MPWQMYEKYHSHKVTVWYWKPDPAYEPYVMRVVDNATGDIMVSLEHQINQYNANRRMVFGRYHQGGAPPPKPPGF